MRTLILITLMGCMPLAAADTKMTADERAQVMKWLEESRQQFLAAIDGVNEQQWKWKPAPDRWSVGEVAEHIVLAEASPFGNVKERLASGAGPQRGAQSQGETDT